jgi:transposase InsO family protein
MSSATTAPSDMNGSTNTSSKSIEEAQEFATQWLWAYNNERPNMGIGGITPAQKLKTAA